MKSVKRPNGDGSIRRKTKKNKNGSEYVYYEGRITVGFDSEGKQIQKTLTAKTQRALVDKMQRFRSELQEEVHDTENIGGHLTLNEFSVEWLNTYLTHVKQSTVNLYVTRLNSYILPTLGSIRLEDLTLVHIQKLYNSLLDEQDTTTPALSPKTVRDVHGILNSCLKCAVMLKYISSNPAYGCKLPRLAQREMNVLDEYAVRLFLEAIKGHVHENLFKLAVFLGLREGELLGLQMDCIDFRKGTLTVKQQLQRDKRPGGTYKIVPTKNNEIRIIKLPPSVLEILNDQIERESEKKSNAGELWVDRGMLFSNPVGDYLSYRTVYDCFKRVVRKIGHSDLRFHDLRHTYATICISIGDSPNMVQKNLGHKTPDLAMRVYEHITAPMRTASANRMEAFIQESAGS